MITGIAHVCIETVDLEQTRHFYCDVLGMEKHFDFIKDGVEFGFYLKVSESNFIEVFATDVLPHIEGKEVLRHICLRTDNIDELIVVLESNGIDVSKKHLGADKSWQVWCKDPNGVDIEFHEYTPESSQLTGKDCHVKW
jgi:catechol 2,3-dioxygenase-like lactoylglutathione lyase family enzyme